MSGHFANISQKKGYFKEYVQHLVVRNVHISLSSLTTSLRPAHESLCDRGILHRDVNAGNIMLPGRDS